MGPEPGLTAHIHLILAHGGIPGLIAELGSVFVALAIFGYFIRRSAKREAATQDKEKPGQRDR